MVDMPLGTALRARDTRSRMRDAAPRGQADNAQAHDGGVSSSSTTSPDRRADFKRLASTLSIIVACIVAVSLTATQVVSDPDSLLASLLIVASVWAYAAGASVLCFWAHYKTAQVTYRYFLVDEVGDVPNRVLYAMLCMTVSHMGQMTLWGLALWIAAVPMGVGELAGETTGTFVDYLHFAFAAYTSLGLGDVKPEGYLKLITGVTTLTGLLCIGWTASMFVGKMASLMEQKAED